MIILKNWFLVKKLKEIVIDILRLRKREILIFEIRVRLIMYLIRKKTIILLKILFLVKIRLFK